VNEPRFDYDPVTLAARGLLIEESRTNLLTYSEQFDNAAWTAQNSTAIANSAAAPDGTISAEKIVPNTDNTPKAVYNNTGLTLTASAYTWSIFAKSAGYNFASLIAVSPNGGARYGITVNLTNGTVTQTASSGTPSSTSYAVTAYANGWYRISITMNASATASASYLVFSAASTGTPTRDSTSLDVTFTGDGTSGVLFWGAQLEAGSFSTSYIKTEAATVTRSADVASVNTLSPWYNASAGTLFAEIGITNPIGAANQYAAEFHNGTANNRIILYRGVGTNTTSVYIADAGVEQASITAGSAIAINSVVKQALGFAANDIGLTSNASAVSTDTSATIPAVNKLNIGSSYGGGEQLNGHIRRIAYYSVRLTNAQLVALTL
jgi:hypothetical protein